jgi:hypothetical protein
MIQVDFFWTFAIGAHLAVAAARQIKKLSDTEKFVNKYFISLVLFMALFFGATGMVLMWKFPHWETMQVYWVHADIPLWFILLWFVTNITNAILAYGICWYFIRKDQDHNAHLQWVIGYFIFFFILIFGWDGTGWMRFTYDATIMGVPWTPGATMGFAWFGSNVAVTLYILGAVFLPPYLYLTTKWAVDGMKDDPDAKDKLPEKGMKAELMVGVFGLLGVLMTFFLALAAAGLGWAFTFLLGQNLAAVGGILGAVIVVVAFYFLGFREGMPFRKLLDKFMNP